MPSARRQDGLPSGCRGPTTFSTAARLRTPAQQTLCCCDMSTLSHWAWRTCSTLDKRQSASMSGAHLR
eukprot:4158708-Heterocapsa_arctica.AAC.1